MKNKNAQRARVGLREIAAAAGVSLATVSRALNGNTRVDPEVQKRVLDAASGLNVDLSQRNKAKAIAFLQCNRAMNDAFHSQILRSAETCCAAHGWDMVFLSFNYSPNVPWKELQLPKIVQRHDVVRAVILAGTNSVNLIKFLEEKSVTFAVLGNNIIGGSQNVQHDMVFSDEIQGGYDMTRYLIRLGHRHVGFVGNTRLPWFSRCFSGYQRAMEEAGFEVQWSNINSEDDAEIGYLGTKSLLSAGKPITAIFAGNDPSAHGVYKALRDSGLRIPDDISVAGCNDTVGSWLYPDLTTIREFPEQLGRNLVEVLLRRIANPRQDPQIITVPTALVKRDSCRLISDSDDPATSNAASTAAVS